MEVDDSEDENEHLFKNSDDDNDIQNILPKKIGYLELEIEADALSHFEESFRNAASTSKHDNIDASTAMCMTITSYCCQMATIPIFHCYQFFGIFFQKLYLCAMCFSLAR